MRNCIANAERIREFLAQEEEEGMEGERISVSAGNMDMPCADVRWNPEKSVEQEKSTEDKEEVLLVENIDFAYNEEKKIINGFSMKVKKENVLLSRESPAVERARFQNCFWDFISRKKEGFLLVERTTSQ